MSGSSTSRARRGTASRAEATTRFRSGRPTAPHSRTSRTRPASRTRTRDGWIAARTSVCWPAIGPRIRCRWRAMARSPSSQCAWDRPWTSGFFIPTERRSRRRGSRRPFSEGAPAFSPDGRWLAYVSNDSGRNELYIRPYPGPGEKITISIDGANEPVWTRGGRELFYRNGDQIFAVDVSTLPALGAGKARKILERDYERTSTLWPNFDVSADGQQFLMVKTLQDAAPAYVAAVLNWDTELKRLRSDRPASLRPVILGPRLKASKGAGMRKLLAIASGCMVVGLRVRRWRADNCPDLL